MARRVGGGKSEGWPAGGRPVFRQHRDVLSKNPSTRPRTRRAGEGMDARVEATQERLPDARRARHRGALFSWLLLFWARKRETSSRREAVRNRFERTQAQAQPATPNP